MVRGIVATSMVPGMVNTQMTRAETSMLEMAVVGNIRGQDTAGTIITKQLTRDDYTPGGMVDSMAFKYRFTEFMS